MRFSDLMGSGGEQEPEQSDSAVDTVIAPYLDAVVAYAFRGTARYHVPGHKGGPGADPGLRKAIGVDCLAADVPQDIHGIDLGPLQLLQEQVAAAVQQHRVAAAQMRLDAVDLHLHQTPDLGGHRMFAVDLEHGVRSSHFT